MVLCSACDNVNVPNLVRQLDLVPPWWDSLHGQSRPRGMLHLLDARQLPPSAARGCPLCTLIVDALLQSDMDQSPPPDSTLPPSPHNIQDSHRFSAHLINSPIYLRPNYDPVKSAFPDEHVPHAWHVRGFKAFVPVHHGVLKGQIRLFAGRDSSAAISCDVIGRPALPSSDSPEAYHLVNSWMNACLSKHQGCRETFAGSVVDESCLPLLPTRVLHVGELDGTMAPRLIETHGRLGYYTALSHCWGSQHGKAPLVTTRTSLQSHIAGIPWSAIPTLYQDAIVATHRLGFQYIWIDSLCIIQDSREDWLCESARMGAVYENARLTIAASHAADSSLPCFFTRSTPPPTVELRHVNCDDEHEGSIFATVMPTDYASISPDSAILATRAWATQEWLLSRRMIFYTADCLVWSCKTLSQRETGASFHSTARNPRWKAIVEKYSARLLTKPTDRLIALEGLSREMSRRHVDDVYCFGVWKKSLPEQLLWYSVEPAERAKMPLHLPTWTWASTLHGVRWAQFKNAKSACAAFRVDNDTKTLTITGAVKKTASLAPFASPSSPAATLDLDALIGPLPDAFALGMKRRLLADDGTTVGWAILDDGGDADSRVTCVRLMTKKIVFTAADASRCKAHRDWVLLVQEADDGAACRRLGVGVVTAATAWFDDRLATHVVIS